jgi:hypothetical protein
MGVRDGAGGCERYRAGNTGSIAGTVVDATGSQVPNATVSVVGSVPRETKTDALGEFVIAGLAPGIYTLQVHFPGFVTRDIATTVVAGTERSLGRIVLNVGVPPSCEQVLSSQLIFDKKLRSGGKPSLSGILRDENGVRLTNATILLLIADTSQAIAIAKTNEKGESTSWTFQAESMASLLTGS